MMTIPTDPDALLTRQQLGGGADQRRLSDVAGDAGHEGEPRRRTPVLQIRRSGVASLGLGPRMGAIEARAGRDLDLTTQRRAPPR